LPLARQQLALGHPAGAYVIDDLLDDGLDGGLSLDWREQLSRDSPACGRRTWHSGDLLTGWAHRP
jgi:hypothetical protein